MENKAPFHPVTNPEPTFPFCPDQTDFLCFKGWDGFVALELNLIEGFQAGTRNVSAPGSPIGQTEYYTAIQLTNNSCYESPEPVPVLVARYGAVKALRYAKERADREIMAAATATQPAISAPAPASSASRWKTPSTP